MNPRLPVRNKKKQAAYSYCINQNPSGFRKGRQLLHRPKGLVLSTLTMSRPKAVSTELMIGTPKGLQLFLLGLPWFSHSSLLLGVIKFHNSMATDTQYLNCLYKEPTFSPFEILFVWNQTWPWEMEASLQIHWGLSCCFRTWFILQAIWGIIQAASNKQLGE